MATKTKATQLGSYVCKVGEYDIRHKIIQPTSGKNHKGDVIISPGSATSSVYLGRDVIKSGFNDHSKAIKYIWSRIKKNGEEGMVSDKVIKKYNLL